MPEFIHRIQKNRYQQQDSFNYVTVHDSSVKTPFNYRNSAAFSGALLPKNILKSDGYNDVGVVVALVSFPDDSRNTLVYSNAELCV